MVRQVKDRAAVVLNSERRSAVSARVVGTLSPREREVLVLMIEGHSNKSIADILGISARTVEIHRGKVIRKLEAGSTAGAVRVGIYAGVDAR